MAYYAWDNPHFKISLWDVWFKFNQNIFSSFHNIIIYIYSLISTRWRCVFMFAYYVFDTVMDVKKKNWDCAAKVMSMWRFIVTSMYQRRRCFLDKWKLGILKILHTWGQFILSLSALRHFFVYIDFEKVWSSKSVQKIYFCTKKTFKHVQRVKDTQKTIPECIWQT